MVIHYVLLLAFARFFDIAVARMEAKFLEAGTCGDILECRR